MQSPDTTVTKLERWLHRLRAANGEKRLVLEVHPTVSEFLREDEDHRLKALRRATGTRLVLEEGREMEVDGYRFSDVRTAEDLTAQHEPR